MKKIWILDSNQFGDFVAFCHANFDGIGGLADCLLSRLEARPRVTILCSPTDALLNQSKLYFESSIGVTGANNALANAIQNRAKNFGESAVVVADIHLRKPERTKLSEPFQIQFIQEISHYILNDTRNREEVIGLLRSPQAMNFVGAVLHDKDLKLKSSTGLCSKVEFYFVTVFDAETFALVH